MLHLEVLLSGGVCHWPSAMKPKVSRMAPAMLRGKILGVYTLPDSSQPQFKQKHHFDDDFKNLAVDQIG